MPLDEETINLSSDPASGLPHTKAVVYQQAPGSINPIPGREQLVRSEPEQPHGVRGGDYNSSSP